MELPLAVRIVDGVVSLLDGVLMTAVGLLLVGVRRPAARLLEAGLFFGLVVVGVSETYRRLGLPLGGHNVVLLAAYPGVVRLFLGVGGGAGLAAGLLAMSLLWLGGLLLIGFTLVGGIEMTAVMGSWPAYAGLWAVSMLPLAAVGVAAWRLRFTLLDLGGDLPVRRQSLVLVNLFLVQVYVLLLLGNVAASRHVHFWEAVPTGLSGYLVWLAVVALPVVSLAVLREVHRLLQQEAEARRGRELEQTVQVAATVVHEVIQPLTTVSCRLQVIGGILDEGVPPADGGALPAGGAEEAVAGGAGAPVVEGEAPLAPTASPPAGSAGGGGEAAREEAAARDAPEAPAWAKADVAQELPEAEQVAALGGDRLALARRWLEDSRRLLQRVEHTGRDFLLLAKVVEPERPVRLGEVAREVAEQCGLLARGRGVTISVYVADGVPSIKGRVGHLEQMVRNLVVNAIEACEDGGRVWVAVRAGEGCVELEVSDNGCGVPPHLRQQIFDPFFTTKEMGTGLGLVVVRQVVAFHGGRITVRDREGGGASFLVTFPIESDPQTSVA